MELEISRLTAGYGNQPVIFDVAASFPGGAVTAIIGPNGAGKSTLFKALFGVSRIFDGSVLLDGQRLARIAPDMLVQRGVAYVPQIGNVFPSLSVRENLEIGTYVRPGGSMEWVLSIFTDLAPVLKKSAGKLSGGQRNMLAVGRALMSNPRVLLLDEATAGLAPAISTLLWEHIKRLAGEGLAVAVVEQNVRLALRFSDHVYLLGSGRNRLDGLAADFAKREDMDQLFLEAAVTH
ncbi:MAG TPA: ABC transporter ATP-binding protein [Chloroflexota bacterium]|nr:ABC transporter ATP-binding protein [Chloroflexota bacterium]